MKRVYLDNAATTPILEEVITAMTNAMKDNFGNPSSTHEIGRKAKVQLETARKKIAKKINVSSNEIVFTSGGTEANNLVLKNAIQNLKIKRVITSKIEHHAVLDVLLELQLNNDFELVFVNLLDNGHVDINDLELKLSETNTQTLVSLMWVNNEIGNILPVKEVSAICKKYQAFFHTDAVQAIGHFKIDLQEYPVDFLVASAHKFHGPKGVGFLYVKKDFALKPIISGGGQERGKRSGTENLHAIIGMEKALDISLSNLDRDMTKIFNLKKYFIDQLRSNFSNIEFNGDIIDEKKSSPTILNVRFPIENNLLLFNLDLNGVCASGGSACQSGASKKSHVLIEILDNEQILKSSVRFSFSKFSSQDEVDFTIEKLKNLI